MRQKNLSSGVYVLLSLISGYIFLRIISFQSNQIIGIIGYLIYLIILIYLVIQHKKKFTFKYFFVGFLLAILFLLFSVYWIDQCYSSYSKNINILFKQNEDPKCATCNGYVLSDPNISEQCSKCQMSKLRMGGFFPGEEPIFRKYQSCMIMVGEFIPDPD